MKKETILRGKEILEQIEEAEKIKTELGISISKFYGSGYSNKEVQKQLVKLDISKIQGTFLQHVSGIRIESLIECIKKEKEYNDVRLELLERTLSHLKDE